MDVILAARQLGKAIQEDERYVKMLISQQKSDEDQELQGMMEAFNHDRMGLNMELQKHDDERDDEKIKIIDTALKKLYTIIFQNENMARYTQTKNDVEQMLAFVNQIISGSANGQNPDEIEFQESCGGECGGCSGCN